MQTELDTMTTRQLNRLRRRIKHVYETAKAEMQDQLTEFIECFKELDEYKRVQLENGNISADDYRTWLRNQVFQSEQMKAKLDNITDICTKTQSTAYKMARHEQYTTFANGANFAYYSLEKQAGASLNLTIYNTTAVQRLLTEQPRILPNKQIKSASNKTYDAKVFNRYVTQGIIQGKNVTEIATQAVNGMADTEMHWAENNAITALTSAQNAGTLQQLKEAKAMGLDVKKQWNATLDYHTRETHRLLDQQTAELEEPFKVLGYQIDYPADPHAAPEMVYHCRCRLTGVLGKYKPRNAKRRDNVTKEVIPEQTYQEWYSNKQNNAANLFQSIRGSGNGSGENGKIVRLFLGTVDTANTKQIKELEAAFCNKFASSEAEHMLVITKDGEVHYLTDNNPKGVDCSYLDDKLKGSYNIHTHPPDSTQFTFSTDIDMPNFFADGSAVMEAVDYKYRYRFERPKGITFEQWETVCGEVRAEKNEIMTARGYALDDYEENIQHVIIDETCRRLGIKCYFRELAK